MEDTTSNAEKFSIVKRVKSFAHAGRGIGLFFKTAHNAWVQVTIFITAVALGVYFDISHIDWILLIFAGGLVLTAEAFNSAIEIDMDLTSPQYHPAARDTKDIAAGAVLIAAITSGAIGVLVFWPYLVG